MVTDLHRRSMCILLHNSHPRFFHSRTSSVYSGLQVGVEEAVEGEGLGEVGDGAQP